MNPAAMAVTATTAAAGANATAHANASASSSALAVAAALALTVLALASVYAALAVSVRGMLAAAAGCVSDPAAPFLPLYSRGRYGATAEEGGQEGYFGRMLDEEFEDSPPPSPPPGALVASVCSDDDLPSPGTRRKEVVSERTALLLTEMSM